MIEVFCTAGETLFGRGDLQSGESILVHAGGSGVGTTAIQMAKHVGATVFFTAGSDAKVDKIMALGADAGINYKTLDFVEEIKRLTAGKGVDVIEDFIGADYMKRNIASAMNMMATIWPINCLRLRRKWSTPKRARP